MNAMFLNRCLAAALCLAAPLFAIAADPLAGARALLAPEPVTQGEFVQTRTLAGIRKPLVSNGRFVVARGLGVLWEDLAPFARTMRLTPGEILQTAEGETLMRLSADREPVVGVITGILFGVLAGDLDALARNFTASGEVEDKRWRLEFTPKDAHLARLIRALVLHGARDVERVEIVSAAGDATRIEFRDVSHAREIPPEVRERFE
jgi:hypothetical protein